MGNSKESDATLMELKAAMEDTRQLQKSLQDLIDEAKVVRKNIDSEALLAFNAKNACEGHATEIAKLKGSAEAEVNSLLTSKQQASEAVAAITAIRAAGDVDIKVISDSRRSAEERIAEIVETASRVQGRASEIDSRRGEIEVIRSELAALSSQASALQQKATEISNSAERTLERTNGNYSQVVEKQVAVSKLAAEVQESSAIVTKLESEVKSAVTRLKDSDAKTQQFEDRLQNFFSEIEGLKRQAEELLPGATSAGLASAFKAQRDRFSIPQIRWLMIFLACILALICVAVPSFLNALNPNITLGWDQVLRSMLLRLPVAIPLVWLAIYAGRNYMMLVRIEEDYAFKEAVSRAFEGYKREMTAISGDSPDGATPLMTLCANVLTVIGDRPGRLYDGKQTAHSVIEEIRDLAESRSGLANRKTTEA